MACLHCWRWSFHLGPRLPPSHLLNSHALDWGPLQREKAPPSLLHPQHWCTSQHGQAAISNNLSILVAYNKNLLFALIQQYNKDSRTQAPTVAPSPMASVFHRQGKRTKAICGRDLWARPESGKHTSWSPAFHWPEFHTGPHLTTRGTRKGLDHI